MSQRIKGQEVEVLIVADGAVQDTITDVRSLEITLKTEIKEEGYLGETTQRFDEIFNGVGGRIELHIENSGIFSLFSLVIERARRREPGAKINIKTTLNFPNGEKPKVQLSDCFFGPFPFGFGSRGDYGTVTLEFACSDYKVIG